MRNLVKSLIILCAILIGVDAMAYVETLRITDEEGQRIAGASIIVVSPDDSSVLFAGLSDKNGNITIPATLPNGCMVDIDISGYIGQSEVLSALKEHIILQREANELQELTVLGKKDRLTTQAGKLIFTPAGLKKQVANLYDLLKFTPMINVEDDIKISGQGNAIVKVNGREYNGSRTQLIEALKATSPDVVKSIEIIAAGASQSSSTNSGIINIVVISPNEGVIGRIGLEGSFNEPKFSTSQSGIVGFAHGGLRGQGYIRHGYHPQKDGSIDTYEYHEEGETVTNNSTSIGTYQGVSGSFNLSYDFKPGMTAGVGVNLGSTYHKNSMEVATTTRSANTETQSLSKIVQKSPWMRPAVGAVLFYDMLTDRKGSKFGITVDYYNSENRTNYDYNLDNQIFAEDLKSSTSGVHAKTYYNHIFSDTQQLEVGYEFTSSSIHDSQALYNSISGLDDFTYSEMNNATYLQWQSNWGKGFSSSVGMRFESLHRKGYQISGGADFNNTINQLIPSLDISYSTPNGLHNFILNVSRDFTPPYYSTLNPYKRYTSDNSYSVGNPNLKPDTSIRLFGTYIYNSNWTFQTRYYDNTDLITDYIYYEGTSTVKSHINSDYSRTIGAEIRYNNTFWNFWTLMASADASYKWGEGTINESDLSFKRFGWQVTWRNNFLLSARHQLRLGTYLSGASFGKNLTVDNWTGFLMSLSLSKEFKNNMSLKIYSSFCPSGRDLSIRTFSNEAYSYRLEPKYSKFQIQISWSWVIGNLYVRSAEDKSSTETQRRIQTMLF